MKKTFLSVVIITILISFCGNAGATTNPSTGHDQKMAWWREAKLGMFIHWGPYALWGGTYHGHHQNKGGAEWIMNRCKIPVAEYRDTARTFNPVQYDPEQWVLLAKQTGMKYIVFTAKHHDGFAMFHTAASDFNIVDYTPYKKDIVEMLADACRKHHMKLGFYYSQAQDWTNPGGSVARKEMWEGWANPDSTRIDAYTAEHNGYWDPAQQTVTMEEYIEKVSLPQVRELLTNYGDVAVIFWDTPVRMTDEFAEKIAKELEKYPQVIQNDRLKRPNYPGDYKTPEGLIPNTKDIEGVDWETCMNIGSSWGYKSWENAWKSSEMLIRNLITIAARGGNYLLNVGPTPEGLIPEEATTRLQDMGHWMATNGEAIYGTQRSEMHAEWGEIIRKDQTKNTVLYLAVFHWPANGKLRFECPYTPNEVTLLSGEKKLNYTSAKGVVEIEMPTEMSDRVATIIKLELKEKLPYRPIISNTAKTFEIQDL